MKSLTRYLTLNLPARMDFVNITAEVEKAVGESVEHVAGLDHRRARRVDSDAKRDAATYRITHDATQLASEGTAHTRLHQRLCADG